MGGGRRAMDTWQSKWEPPRPVHNNPCLVVGCNDTEALKEAFEKHGTVQDVFNPEGQNFAFVRFGAAPPPLLRARDRAAVQRLPRRLRSVVVLCARPKGHEQRTTT